MFSYGGFLLIIAVDSGCLSALDRRAHVSHEDHPNAVDVVNIEN